MGVFCWCFLFKKSYEKVGHFQIERTEVYLIYCNQVRFSEQIDNLNVTNDFAEVYCMGLERLYYEVKSYIDKVDFSKLWRGFEPLKFALYTDSECFFDGTAPLYQR